MATKKTKKADSAGWPKVTVGSHLTVTTHEDGRSELTWDDEALMRDVQEAIASVDNTITPAKKTRKKTA